jgi:tetratricopeptide (TPR) repeat protein
VDSGVIVAAAKTLGIPNPPGFPLYLLVGNLFTKIPWGSVVFRLQLLSMLSSVGICVLVWSFFKNWIGVAAALALGFSYGLWEQAINVESYTFTNFLLFLWLFFIIKKGKEIKGWKILPLGLLMGLSLGVNPIIVVLAPTGLWWMYRNWSQIVKNKNYFILGFVALIIGFLAIYSYLPIRAATKPFLNWGDPSNLERIKAHLFGKGLDIYEPETNSINGFTWQPKVMLESLVHYLKLFLWQFTPVLAPVVLFGAWTMWKKNRSQFELLVVPLIFNLLFVVLYYGGNQESWMITSWVIAGIWLGVGAGELGRWGKLGRLGRWGIYAMALVPLLFWFPLINRSKDNFAQEYADNMYEQVPEGSVIVGGGDFFNSLTNFTHEVTGQRKDIVPITGNMFYIFPWYREGLRKNTSIKISQELEEMIKFKSVDEFTNAIDKLIEDNPDRQVFVTPLLLRDTVVAGHKEGNYHTQKYDLVPHGLLLKVVPKGLPVPPREDLLTNVSFGKAPFYLERNYKNAYRLLRNDYAVAALNLGEYWWQRQETQKAGDYFNRALELGSPEAPDFVHRMAIFYAQVGQKDQAKSYFEKALALVPDDAVIKQNYQNFLGEKPVEPEIEKTQEEMAEYKTKSIAFKYPKDWKVTKQNETVKLEEKEGKMTMEIMTEKRLAKVSVEEYLGKKLPLSEKLVNQGLAKIPSFDLAYVKIWQAETLKMQFFLFKSDVVVEVRAWPGDSPLMRVFDSVVSSIIVL